MPSRIACWGSAPISEIASVFFDRRCTGSRRTAKLRRFRRCTRRRRSAQHNPTISTRRCVFALHSRRSPCSSCSSASNESCGRVRRERWGPRTLDLDLLFISGQAVDLPGLVVPHRELTQRAFALLPLLDVAPEACDPVTGQRYSEVVLGLDRTGVRELPNSRAGWLE